MNEDIENLKHWQGIIESRVKKLEDIICQLFNTPDEEIDTEELGMAHAEAREGYDDR